MLDYSLNFPKHSASIQSDFVNYVENLPLFKFLETEFSKDPYLEALGKLAKFKQIIHLGTGGSSLGPQALYGITDQPSRNFTFFDNIDPTTIAGKVGNTNFAQTGLLIASKSGNTAETLIQLATFKKLYDDQGLKLQDHLVIITQTDGNALHTFAKANDILVVAHHNQIGGRFAVFAEVGILPGILMGHDMADFRKGAQAAVAELKASVISHPAVESACFLAGSKFNPVVFPYADKLKLFGAWFAQLWAESLGKKNIAGERFGSTPIQALGATDQHSQLQLYLDGPQDKFFTLLEVSDKADLAVADLRIEHTAYVYLRNHRLGDLLSAELRATYATLHKNGLPLRLITVPVINSYYLAQLMINTVLETLAVARIWDVNPFDQPAVEEGKLLALKFLNDKKEQLAV